MCGASVAIPEDDPLFAAARERAGVGSPSGSERADRLISALCGCYVFRMDESALGRLLAGILATDDDLRGASAD